MSEPSLSATEVLAWVEKTSEKWKRLLTDHPEVLALPCDVAGVSVVSGLLQHIVAVELRYAERLKGLPETSYEQIPSGTVDEIYATHDRAMALVREMLVDEGYNWSQTMVFQTRTLGPIESTAKTIVFHMLLHSIRHYGQLATLVRQHGINPGWPMDYLMMGARRAAE
ncbi:DinB family protein [Paracidobacterium acidisoli]|uniref:DUF664 domain-containing protein n=1 Tax=Paracidobacterium acidisoli TaxID=2303751 RepID=A0A372IPJ5_9BACT|nr:DinB family protein [Paracidobacterium acidisoli]MBT9331181.1 DinB family protein [Paracidobacterium acidisoli]